MDSSLSILHYFIAVFTLLKITPCARALDVDALRGALTDAEVVAVFRDDPGYVNASSAYNLRYDISPIVIAYPSTPQQVSAVVQAGGAQKLAVTARSGGHSYIAAGLGGKDGALVVDMGSFNETSVNETDNTANVGAGVLLGDLALALNEYGRALPHGRCPTVGLGGHATGGGYGHTSVLALLRRTCTLLIRYSCCMTNGIQNVSSAVPGLSLMNLFNNMGLVDFAPHSEITNPGTVSSFFVPKFELVRRWDGGAPSRSIPLSYVGRIGPFLFRDLPRINKPPPPPPPSRMWGMLLDHIVSATVVLSDGSIVTASELENADLFWAIRGAGPSFGIVIEFVFATELIPLGGTTFRYGWNLTAVDAIHALATFQDFVESDIPPAFGAQLNFNKSTVVGYVNMEYFGEHWGHPTTLDETNERFLDKLPPPDSVDSFCGDWIAVLNASAWGDLNTSATPPQHSTFYIKSLMVPEAEGLSPTAVGAFVQYLTDERSVTSDLSWFVEIELYGGSGSAINTVGTDKTAFPHRDKVFTMQLAALSPNDRPPYPDDGFSFLDDLVNAVIESEPSGWPYGAYANYADARLQNWRTLYFGDNYQELSRMKTLYDPTNIFRSPLSVEMDIL